MREFGQRLFKWGGKIEPLLWLYALIPLIYFSNNSSLSRKLRLLSYLVIICLAVCSAALRNLSIENFRSLKQPVKFLLVIFLVLVVYSCLRGSQTVDLRLIGYVPEYLGVLSWLSFVFIALLFSRDINKALTSPYLLVILMASLGVSLITDLFYIRNGFRVSGVMFQPTTMGMYAAAACAVAPYHLAKKPMNRWVTGGAIAALVLAVAVIILSQSRIGYAAAILVLSSWAVLKLKVSKWVSLSLVTIVIALAVIPRLSQSYFSRFYASSVDRGVSYRLDLYRTSAKDLAKHNVVLGNGPSSLPTAINNKNQVSEEIAASLHLGYIFASTHDLYFDIAYFFGCLAALAFLALNGIAFWRPVKKLRAQPVLFLLTGVMVLNALFNVPSLELTSLYFVALFGLLQLKLSS